MIEGITEWFIADTHFGDRHVVQGGNARPFSSVQDMADTVAKNWHALVQPADTVWVLGDVGKDVEVFRDLPGRKFLVGGNCDRSLAGYPQGLFEETYGVKYLKGLILSHVPVHDSELKGRANVHGHLHTKRIEHDRYLCVSVDQTGFRPISRAKVEWSLDRHWMRRYPIPAGRQKVAA